MSDHVIHISEEEAARDFTSLLDHVRAGSEVVIESERGKLPVAVVRPAEPPVRLLSESLRLAKEHASTATLDGDFARDLEAAVNSHREPLNPPCMGLMLDSSVVILKAAYGWTCGAGGASVPSDHCCVGITNWVRCSWGSATAMTGEPGRLAPQIAGSVSE